MKSNYPFLSLGEYNGKPMFIMSSVEDKAAQNKFNTFQFGMEKAKALIEHQDALNEFVESGGQSISKVKASTNGEAKAKKAKPKSKALVEQQDRLKTAKVS